MEKYIALSANLTRDTSYINVKFRAIFFSEYNFGENATDDFIRATDQFKELPEIRHEIIRLCGQLIGDYVNTGDQFFRIR